MFNYVKSDQALHYLPPALPGVILNNHPPHALNIQHMQARLIKFYQMEKKKLTFHVEFKDGVGPTAFPPTWPRANSVKGKKACVRLTIVSRLILMSAK